MKKTRLARYVDDSAVAQTLGQYGVEGSGDAIIDEILIVGGLLDDAQKYLSSGDQNHLKKVISEGSKLGIAFSRAAKVRVCNLAYGHDFLNGRNLRTKFAAFNYIYYNPLAVNITRGLYLSQSPLAATEKLWHQRLVNTGAQWAVNVHSSLIELPTSVLAQPPFEKVHTVRTGRHSQIDFLMRKLG